MAGVHKGEPFHPPCTPRGAARAPRYPRHPAGDSAPRTPPVDQQSITFKPSLALSFFSPPSARCPTRAQLWCAPHRLARENIRPTAALRRGAAGQKHVAELEVVRRRRHQPCRRHAASFLQTKLLSRVRHGAHAGLSRHLCCEEETRRRRDEQWCRRAGGGARLPCRRHRFAYCAPPPQSTCAAVKKVCCAQRQAGREHPPPSMHSVIRVTRNASCGVLEF